MSRRHTHPLALVLGVTLLGSAVQAAPPRQPGDEPDPPRGVRSVGGMPTLVYDNVKADPQPRYASDHIVVRFGPGVSAAMRRQITWSLGGRDYVQAEFGNFGRVPVRPGEDPRALARRFRNNPDVEMADVDWLVYAAESQVRLRPRDELAGGAGVRARGSAADTRSVRPGAARSLKAPATKSGGTHGGDASRQSQVGIAQNDPFFTPSGQWFHDRIRTREGESINPTRGAGAVAAVIDTGVLSGTGNGSASTCEANYPRGRGLDMGGTRFVAGRDFVDDDNQPFDEGGALFPNDPLSPRLGHGTFVASIIAAAAGNDLAGRGVAPNVSIMPLRVLGRSGFGNFSDVAEAIDFAVANGADVINMSLGGEVPADEWAGSPPALAIQRAHAAGVVLVAASGNAADRRDPPPPTDADFPARDPNVIAVGATRFNDNRASYSNFGPGVDIMAPGGESPSSVVNQQTDTRDAVLSPTFVVCPNPADCIEAFGLPGPICASFWSTGTSFAAPQVAAAAALLKALGVEDPDVIRTLLQNGARDIGAQGFDNETGHGLVDLFEAHQGFGFSFE